MAWKVCAATTARNLRSDHREKMRSLLLPSGAPERETDDVVQRALRAVRIHLGMEVAYISEIDGDRSVFRYVDAPGQEALIKVGDTHFLDDVYCRLFSRGACPS
jgi:hypothetical protein